MMCMSMCGVFDINDHCIHVHVHIVFYNTAATAAAATAAVVVVTNSELLYAVKMMPIAAFAAEVAATSTARRVVEVVGTAGCAARELVHLNPHWYRTGGPRSIAVDTHCRSTSRQPL